MDDGAAVIYIISKETGKIVWKVGPDYSEIPQLRRLGMNIKPPGTTKEAMLPGTSG